MPDATTMPVSTPQMDWTALIGGLTSGISGLTGAGQLDPTKLAGIADPYSGQRSQYWPMISGLISDPSSFLKSSMFTDPLKLGGESLSRQFGAKGLGNSGNVDAALQDYGTSSANNYLQQWLGTLENVGGVNAGSPAAAGQIASQAGQYNIGQRTGSVTGAGAGLAQILSAFGTPAQAIQQIMQMLGGGNSGSPGFTPPGGWGTDQGSNWSGSADPTGGVTDPSGGGGGGFDFSSLFSGDLSGLGSLFGLG